MTKWEAVKKLEEIMDRWIDFDLWAYLQLEMRGEYSDGRMAEVLNNHERAELRLNELRAEIDGQAKKMEEDGAAAAEINAYTLTRGGELHGLVTAWRSLDGLPE